MTTDFKILEWNKIHVTLFTFLFILYTIIPERYPVIILGGISFVLFWLTNYIGLKKFKPFAGYANWITMLRLILIIIIALSYKNFTNISLFIIGLAIVSLDGLDGFVARKLNQKSEFGAYFDMESDAFYVCLFTIILFEKGLTGYWIIIPGFMRYLYGTIILLIGKKSKEEIRTKIGPIIAGIFFIAILSPFVLPINYYHPILIISSALIMLSFLYSFIQLITVKAK